MEGEVYFFDGEAIRHRVLAIALSFLAVLTATIRAVV